MSLRGDICWADLGVPRGSAPGYRRPVVVISADRFNASLIRTVTVAAVTSNVRLAGAPGNLLVESGASGLDRDSVVNVSALFTLDEDDVEQPAGRLSRAQQRLLDDGLRLALSL